MTNKRSGSRISLQIALNEYIKDMPYRCTAVDLGEDGMRLHLPKPQTALRGTGVGLEFELPGTFEVIWASGMVRYDGMDDYLHGTGIQFMRMARGHRSLIRDYVAEKKASRLKELLEAVRHNRMH